MTRKPFTPATSGLQLTDAFAVSLTDLAIEAHRVRTGDVGEIQRRLGEYLAGHPDRHQLLADGLTRAIADRAYLRLVLDHLKARAPELPYEDEIPDDREERILNGGPGRLTGGELAWLALAPEQLHAFHEVVGERMTHFWVYAIEDAMAASARERGESRLSTEELTKRILALAAEKQRSGNGSARPDEESRRTGPAREERAAAHPKAGPPNSGDPTVTVPASQWPARALRLRRNWRKVAALSGVAATVLVFVFVFLPRPDPVRSGVAMASNSVVDHPEEAVRDRPNRKPRGDGAFYLLPGDNLHFRASHTTPQEHQWLIHIANSAQLVASAGRTEEISYVLRQLDNNWARGDSRYELLVLVTADKAPAGWPQRGGRSIDLGELFTADVIAKLQDVGEEPNVKMRHSQWIQEIGAVLDRRFGPNPYGFQVYAYGSDKE